MKSSLGKTGTFALQFREKYLRSLHDLRFFYDDVAEIGNAETAEHAFYFVPGINGTPGQMRFLLPSLIRVYGNNVYLKSLHLPEFSARVATWEKYTVENINRKLARLREDLCGVCRPRRRDPRERHRYRRGSHEVTWVVRQLR